MNGGTSKLIRLYVGLRARQGRGVKLKDVKRRYRMTPRPLRHHIKDAMAAYLDRYEPSDRRELRASRPRGVAAEGRGRMGKVLQAIAGFMGLAR